MHAPYAQETAPPLDISYVPMASGVQDKMLDMTNIIHKEKHNNLGSGSGRIVIEAAKHGSLLNASGSYTLPGLRDRSGQINLTSPHIRLRRSNVPINGCDGCIHSIQPMSNFDTPPQWAVMARIEG